MSALQFLLLEANLPDAEVVQATLIEGGIDCQLLRVETRADFIKALETDEIDLILADYALSGFDDIAALTIAHRLRPEIPFIFISGSLGEELAIEAIKQGATDYVLKQRLGRLVPSVQRALQEVPKLNKDTTKRQQAEATVESDLKNTQLLHELSARLVIEDDIQTLYQEIIAAAIALTRADAGTVQILDEATQDLLLLATQGFKRNMLDHFYRVSASSNTSCGMALKSGDRAFLDFDVPKSADPDGSMQMHMEAGYFSAQSTPLITRSGKAIGMVSTHWCKHHRPSDRELRFLDLLARQAADLIEQRQAEAALRESEAWLAGQKEAFQAALKGVTLEASLGVLVRTVVEQANTDIRCAFYIGDETGSELYHVVGMPENYVECVDGFKISADSLACGLAFYTNQPVITPDVTEDPRWQDWLWLAQQHEYRGVWSFPIETTQGKVVGTFAMYFRQPRQATPRDYEFAAVLTQAAAIIISQNQEAVERARAEATLRESEAKYRSLFESIDEGYFLCDVILDENDQPVDLFYLDTNPAATRMVGQDFRGRRLREIDPNYEEYWYEIFGRVAKTGQGERLVQYAAPDQTWYDFYVFKVGSENTRRVAVVFKDITDRKRREANLTFLADLMNDFAPLVTAEEVMEMAGRRITEHLDLSRYMFVEIFPEAGTCTYLLPSHPPGQLEISGSFVLADYHTKEEHRLLCAGHSMVVNDVRDGTRTPGQIAAFEMFDIGSIVNTPYLSNGRWVFDLGVARSKPSVWREDEIELLRELSARVWLRIERARAEANLRQSEEKYRSLFNSIDEGYFLAEVIFGENDTAVDILYLEANPAAMRLAGRDFSRQRMREIDPHYEDYWYEIYGRVALTGEAVRAERYAEPHGRWFDFYAFKIGGQESRRVAAVFQDITERKHRELNTAFLDEIGKELSVLSAPDEIIQTVGDRLSEFLQASICIFADVDEAKNEATIHHGWNTTDVVSLKQTFRLADYFGEEFARAGRAGETVIVRDTAQDERANAEAYARLNIGSFVTVPFQRNGRWTANITVTTREPRDWQEDEIGLLQEIINRVFPRIERAHAEAELRRVAEIDAFRVKLSDALRSLSDPIVVQEVACRVLGEYLGANRVLYSEMSEGSGSQTLIRVSDYTSGVPSRVGWHRLDDFGTFVTETWRSGRNLVWSSLDDLPNLQADERIAYEVVEIEAIIGVPLVKEGQFEAFLAVHQATPRKWTAEEIALVEETAERTWAAVERARAEESLRESEIQRIREQAAREEERQRAESLAELDRAKTLFFSNVSHEFRTPLTLILAPLQDALSNSVNPLPQEQREQLELAHRNSLRLLKLVNTLLDFSRIEADRLKANYEPTDLSTYTAELASVFRSAIENANLQLVVDCPPLPDPIYVDREMWEKMVLNLLSNALKFTFEGIISVSLKPKANTVELIVSDTGVGISAYELPHLFERFYQVKGAKGRTYEGSGIGLSLVQELVKQHGGAIAVTSAVDQGTTFTVTIPTGIAHLPADQIEVASTLASTAVTANAFVDEAFRWLSEESTEFQNSEVQAQNSEVGVQNSEVQAQSSEVGVQNSEVGVQNSEVGVQNSEVGAQNSKVQVQNSEVQAQSSEVDAQNSEVQVQNSEVQVQNSKSARILLVDDNADMRGYLRRLLNQYYEVEAVNDGLAALTAIRSGGSTIYDLVLADVMMPRMDGFELLRSLRASPNTQTIPIILLSARAGEESRVQGLETGADDYLIKPFSARELLARVDVNLKLAQLRREAVYREQVMQAVQTLNERLEQQVKARTAQLEAINQELEAFSSTVSHDLRTPLRYISSFAERLQGKLNPTLVDASSFQILNIIAKSALEAEKMVDDLLEFSRLGKTEMHLTTVNISQLVQQVQAQLQSELVGRSLYWQIEPLATVEGDPTLLRLVVQNLLSNAVKYTRNNTEAAITIGSIEQEQEVIFFVKDNGAGFDMKYCDRLFSMFQRLHPQEEFPGTGVGLATVRRIIHRHGGRIWAEGAIDQGATFYFSLPKHEV